MRFCARSQPLCSSFDATPNHSKEHRPIQRDLLTYARNPYIAAAISDSPNSYGCSSRVGWPHVRLKAQSQASLWNAAVDEAATALHSVEVHPACRRRRSYFISRQLTRRTAQTATTLQKDGRVEHWELAGRSAVIYARSSGLVDIAEASTDNRRRRMKTAKRAQLS